MSMEAEQKQILFTLAQRGIVIIDRKIDGGVVEYVRESIFIAEAHNAPALDVRITSNGGSVRAGLDIYDMIRLSRFPSRSGIILAYARSMGAIILQACDKRLCAKHASVLIHYISSNNVSLDTLKDSKRLAEEIKSGEEDQKALDSILANRTGKSVKEIRRVCAKDSDMSAEEALKFGLIDEII